MHTLVGYLRRRTQRHGRVRVLTVFVLLVAGWICSSMVVQYLTARSGARARKERLAVEAHLLYDGMERFKEKFGAFPPNFDDDEAVMRFVGVAFPKYVEGVSAPPPKQLDAARALVFWLSEVGTDPADPFAWNAKERFQFCDLSGFQFEQRRFSSAFDMGDGPYVYFHHASYEAANYHGMRPYRRGSADRPGEYLARDSIQIIGSGEDGELGRGGFLDELGEKDRDNVVSFSAEPVGMMQLEKE